jgi:phage shock protein A
MGDQYNDLRQQIANVATPAEFVAGAQQAQAHIAALKQQPNLLPAEVRRLEVVEGDVKEVIEEAKKPKPLGERINATLTSAKETMDRLGGSVKSAMELGAILGGLAQIALKIFGVSP